MQLDIPLTGAFAGHVVKYALYSALPPLSMLRGIANAADCFFASAIYNDPIDDEDAKYYRYDGTQSQASLLTKIYVERLVSKKGSPEDRRQTLLNETVEKKIVAYGKEIAMRVPPNVGP